MKVELSDHWVRRSARSGVHELRLNDRLHTPGITIFCLNKTFLFIRVTIDEFGERTSVEFGRPWPTGLPHKRRLRGLKTYLIAQYKLEET